MPRFLLVRPADHLIVGLDWTNCDIQYVEVPGPSPAPSLVARDGARLSLTFPPQCLAEEKFYDNAQSDMPAGSVASGSSLISLTVPAGTIVPLTPHGVLGVALDLAWANEPTVLVEAAGSRLEIPWGMHLIPTEDKLHLSHVALPLWKRQADGEHSYYAPNALSKICELWNSKLLKLRSAERKIKVQCVPLGRADPPFPVAPLSQADRNRLRGEAWLTRLRLSPFGASASIHKNTDPFWGHELRLGREHQVTIETSGILYPFGHLARITAVAERDFWNRDLPDRENPFAGAPIPGPFAPVEVEQQLVKLNELRQMRAGAVSRLNKKFFFEVIDPTVNTRHNGSPLRNRRFPFDEVELCWSALGGQVDERPFEVASIGEPMWEQAGSLQYFIPCRPDRSRIAFPIKLRGQPGYVEAQTPLIFVAGGHDNFTHPSLAQAWAEFGKIPVPNMSVDLVRGAHRQRGDTHEVTSLSVAIGAPDDTGRSPGVVVTSASIRLPAMREIANADSVVTATYNPDYIRDGDHPAPLILEPQVSIDFRNQADKAGALVAPCFTVGAISRSDGPISKLEMNSAEFDAISDILGGSTILGLPLERLIDQSGRDSKPPRIVANYAEDGKLDTVTMTMSCSLQSDGPFVSHGSTASIDVLKSIARPGARDLIECTLNNFSIVFPESVDSIIRLKFDKLTYRKIQNQPADVSFSGIDLLFAEQLSFFSELAQALGPLLGRYGPQIDIATDMVSAGYEIPLPPVSAGAFKFRNVRAHIGLRIPFRGDPISLEVGFASPDRPFQVAVPFFGGGGYFRVSLTERGVGLIQFSMEFGGNLSLDLILARGELFAYAGISFTKNDDGNWRIAAFIRFGGSAEVMHLVGVSISVLVLLEYDSDKQALFGEGEIVIEPLPIIFPKGITLPFGKWEIPFSGEAIDLLSDIPLIGDAWVEAQEAF